MTSSESDGRIACGIRTPLEVMELVCEDELLCPSVALRMQERLVAALRCATGTVMYYFDGVLSWGHVVQD